MVDLLRYNHSLLNYIRGLRFFIDWLFIKFNEYRRYINSTLPGSSWVYCRLLTRKQPERRLPRGYRCFRAKSEIGQQETRLLQIVADFAVALEIRSPSEAEPGGAVAAIVAAVLVLWSTPPDST